MRTKPILLTLAALTLLVLGWLAWSVRLANWDGAVAAGLALHVRHRDGRPAQGATVDWVLRTAGGEMQPAASLPATLDADGRGWLTCIAGAGGDFYVIRQTRGLSFGGRWLVVTMPDGRRSEHALDTLRVPERTSRILGFDLPMRDVAVDLQVE